MQRGRKRSIPKDVIINTILKHKKDIVLDDNKVVSKTALIW